MAGENSLNGRFIESWSVASYPWIATEGRGGRCIVADDVPFRESFPRRTEVKDIGDIVPGLESLVTLREKRATFKEAILLAGNTVENRVSRVDYDSNKNSTTLLSLSPRDTFLLLLSSNAKRFSIISFFLSNLETYWETPPPLRLIRSSMKTNNSGLKETMRCNAGKKKKLSEKERERKGKKRRFHLSILNRLNRARTKRSGI